jgi:transcriptional antiterminator NusG
MNWYVLQVVSGREADIRDALTRRRIPAKAPRALVYIHRRGAWGLKEKILIPGYVFLGAQGPLPDEIYYSAAAIPGVIRVLGTPRAQPSTEREARYLNLLAPDDGPLRPIAVRRRDGKIAWGALAELGPGVQTVDWHRRRVKIRVPVAGGEKTIEISIAPIVAACADEPPAIPPAISAGTSENLDAPMAAVHKSSPVKPAD